tara:strand:- start:500 stop:661 length:162 start_codon:yes stop_codon:yes gene_type:complete
MLIMETEVKVIREKRFKKTLIFACELKKARYLCAPLTSDADLKEAKKYLFFFK